MINFKLNCLTQYEFHDIADESMFRNNFQLKHSKTEYFKSPGNKMCVSTTFVSDSHFWKLGWDRKFVVGKQKNSRPKANIATFFPTRSS